MLTITFDQATPSWMSPPRTAAEIPLLVPRQAAREDELPDTATWSREEFQQAVAPLLPRLYRFCLALCHDDASAEDLLQSGLVRAYVRRSSYSQSGSFAGWLCQVLRNVHADTVRTEARRRSLLEAAIERFGFLSDTASPASADPESFIGDADDVSLLLTCLREVPEKYRTVLFFCDIEEMTHQEAATTLGVPIGTIKSRQMRGRKMLRRAYEAQRDLEPGRVKA